MAHIFPTLATIAVSALFCLWDQYRRIRAERRRILCERVARMLWKAAMRSEAA